MVARMRDENFLFDLVFMDEHHIDMAPVDVGVLVMIDLT